MESRAVLVRDLKGDPQETWELVKREKPRASAGHVVVHMTLRPINPTDTLSLRAGIVPEFKDGVVVGSEGVGYVEEVGEGVTTVKVGQRVVPSFFKQFYAKGNGSWQDYVEVHQDEVFLVSELVPDEVAAQFIINPWTAYGLVRDQFVPKGEYLLQTAAGSVLGRMVIQLAKHWHMKTINVVRRDELKEELKSLGADEVINSTTEDLVARVKEITGGKGAYGALDAVAGTMTKDVVASVRDGGKVFIYGALSSLDATVRIFDFGRVQIKWWVVHEFVSSKERMHEVCMAVGNLLEKKVIVPLTGKTYRLEDFKEALLEAEKPNRGGKVLLGT